MNRLTEKRDSGSWGVKGVDWKQIAPSAKITDEVWRKLYGALYKLKDYEDTGLMPDEIGKLNTEAQEEARKMLEKVAELSEEIEKAQEKTRWIPVTERLPEVSCNSIILCFIMDTIKRGVDGHILHLFRRVYMLLARKSKIQRDFGNCFYV